MQASQAGFLTETNLTQRSLPEVHRRHQTWRSAARALSADRAAILHYTFEEQAGWDQVLTNQVKNAPAASTGHPQLSMDRRPMAGQESSAVQ